MFNSLSFVKIKKHNTFTKATGYLPKKMFYRLSGAIS